MDEHVDGEVHLPLDGVLERHDAEVAVAVLDRLDHRHDRGPRHGVDGVGHAPDEVDGLVGEGPLRPEVGDPGALAHPIGGARSRRWSSAASSGPTDAVGSASNGVITWSPVHAGNEPSTLTRAPLSHSRRIVACSGGSVTWPSQVIWKQWRADRRPQRPRQQRHHVHVVLAEGLEQVDERAGAVDGGRDDERRLVVAGRRRDLAADDDEAGLQVGQVLDAGGDGDEPELGRRPGSARWRRARGRRRSATARHASVVESA